ncbi:alpha/beta fold hydrolase [Telluribacter sp. SYSU D00476]|uniref:alpha/beta hydrolase family protein n=1 Tax=Telluribacter sp. SYSU D00476 TaxID=2811430 RepID=UPI001FF456DA|nr:alpha/beta fold hydrolase [Telluribacter sp. SYSU D00476]
MKKTFILFILLSVTRYGWSQDQAEPLVLPKPSGKFQVGRYGLSLKDPSRQNREIPLFIYYPTTSVSTTSYIIPTDEWRQQYLPVLQKKLGGEAGKAVAFGKAYFTEGLRLNGKEKFPLILFAPGMGWSTLEYSYIIQELVSAGYMVAALNSSPLAPVLQASDGTFIAADKPKDSYQLIADDITFVLHQIKTGSAPLQNITKHIDPARVALAGHSLGGAAALLAADINPEIKAAVNMDGDMMDASLKAAPRGSVLFLNQIPAAFDKKSFTEMQADPDLGWRYQQMTKATAHASQGKYIAIAGMYHSNFQDYALLPTVMIPENIRKYRLGPIDGNKCLQLISKTLISYFDEALNGKKADRAPFEKENPDLRVTTLK